MLNIEDHQQLIKLYILNRDHLECIQYADFMKIYGRAVVSLLLHTSYQHEKFALVSPILKSQLEAYYSCYYNNSNASWQ